MRKRLARICTLMLVIGILTACGKDDNSGDQTTPSGGTEAENTPEPVNVSVAALKGPTAMGMVKFMDDADNGRITSNNYTFTIAAAVDEITPKIIQGDFDIAAIPANLAAVLYNNSNGQVQVMAINTLGVLYIVERGNTVSTIEDLRGKTIFASGKGATPEYALNYILQENGIDPGRDVTIEWKSEHAECVAALAANENAIAMLPQPFVSTAQSTEKDIQIALDLNEEWDRLQAKTENPSGLITGVVVVRTEFARENPDVVNDFLNHYANSVEFVNSDPGGAAALIGKFNIVPEAIAKKALPYCNITFIEGHEMKEKLAGYLKVLYEQNPQAVGGALPGAGFYFGT